MPIADRTTFRWTRIQTGTDLHPLQAKEADHYPEMGLWRARQLIRRVMRAVAGRIRLSWPRSCTLSRGISQSLVPLVLG